MHSQFSALVYICAISSSCINVSLQYGNEKNLVELK